MNKLTKVISGVWVFCFFSLPAISQNVAVIDTQAAILQTQVAQDAFKALEEETEYSSMVEEAKELQAKRQNMVEKLQKDAEALSNEEITELQKDIQENHSFSYKSKGFSPNLFLPFVPGKSENTKTVINKANIAKTAITIKNIEKFPPAKSSKSADGMRTNKGA